MRRALLIALLASLCLARASADASPSRRAAFPGGPNFVLECRFSHRSNDDPIKYPNQPGLSHNHTFIGNVTTGAATTPASLLGGKTTCDFPATSLPTRRPTGHRRSTPADGRSCRSARSSTTSDAPRPRSSPSRRG